MRRLLGVEVEKTRKLLAVNWTPFLYVGSASSISKETVRIALEYLNLSLKIKDVVDQIEHSPIRAFRLCPISCIQHPVIFFLTPYPSELLPFLSHTLSHEVLHIKHAFFSKPKTPYFVREADVPDWKRAGYSAFSYEKHFQDIIDLVGIENTHRLVWDYCERIHDFLVNKELLSFPEFAQVTRTWETSQSNIEVSILRRDSTSSCPSYECRIAMLDLGMRLKLLEINRQEGILKEVGQIPTGLNYLSHLRKISELFSDLRIPLELSRFKEFVFALDQIVSLSKAIITA